MIAVDFEERIDAYEAALQGGESATALLHAYLPPINSVDYLATLVECLRIALEREWEQGQRGGIEHYRAEFPLLFANPSQLEPLAFEEYRLRCAAGESVSKQVYTERYGVDVAVWPDLSSALSASAEMPTADQDWLEFSRQEPATALRALVGQKVLPQVGEKFGTFQLVALLGEGAFGRVFLARQQSLAQRLVALKITFGKPTEAQKLARLQHGNIMPVYSVHRRGNLAGICMPFLGSATLADMLRAQRRAGLPLTAESLVRTLVERRSEFSTLANDEAVPNAHIAANAPRLTESLVRASNLQSLESYILPLMLQVADGLAQAHERGILHRDIKPANILIADDGKPLLLDFNLATEQSGHMARIGGTLPYMSPEQLAQFQGSNLSIDGRSDIYSLGVVLFECLTGSLPWEVRRGALDAIVPPMIADRRENPRDVRSLNPSISPGLAAIVACCLQPNPQHRYQQVSALRDDLRLHCEHRPLRHTRNPSAAELAAKWCRRHPRLTSVSSVLAIVSCLAVTAGMIWLSREEQLADRVAVTKFHAAEEDLLKARTLLLVGGPGSELEAEGVRTAQKGLHHYEVLSRPEWFLARNVRRLGNEDRRQLVQDATEVLQLLARRPHAELPDSASLAAIAQNGRRALIGESPTVDEHSQGDLDFIFAISDPSEQASFVGLEAKIKQLTIRRPHDAFAWLALAHVCRLQSHLTEAEVAANAAVALRDDLELAWQLRGMVYQAQRRWQDAEKDFTRAITLRNDQPTSWFNRGTCRQELQEHQAAIEDFTAAIDKKFSESRVYFARARSYRERGDQARATADIERGQALPPRDATSYVARALSYLPQNSAAAEDDLAAAQQLEPTSRMVLMNLAHVQAEHRQKTEQAIEVLARIEQLYPDDTDAIGSHAVLLARLQRREEAVAQLKRLLKTTVRPPLAIYQSACVYALLSKDQPALRSQAMQLLATSLAVQPNLVNTARDDVDLANLREEPMFARLVAKPKNE